MGPDETPIVRNQALNERDYGDLSGLNKDDARKKWGEEQVLIWRRSYDVPPPGGESLRTRSPAHCPITCRRSSRGSARRSILVWAPRQFAPRADHGDRGLTPGEILKRELATGVPMIYRMNADSTVASKLDLAA